MKRMIVAGIALLALTGCTSYDTLGGIRTEQVSLPDGRTVVCVVSVTSQGSSLDCDWESAK